MSAATSLGYSYQRLRWPPQSLPFSSFSSQARCLGLRVLIFIFGFASAGAGLASAGGELGAVGSAMRFATLPRSLNPMTPKNSTHRAAGALPAMLPARREQELKESVRGYRQLLVVAKPPGLGPARQMIYIDVFYSN